MQESSCNCGRNIDYKEISNGLQRDLRQKTIEVETLTAEINLLKDQAIHSSLLIATLTDNLKTIKLEKGELKTDNEHLDKENDEQAREYVETKKALEKECERYKMILKEDFGYSDDDDEHNEKPLQHEIQKNMNSFVQYTDITTLSPYLTEFNLMTRQEYSDIVAQHKGPMHFYSFVLPMKGLSAYRTFYRCLKKAVKDPNCNSGHRDLLIKLDSVIK